MKTELGQRACDRPGAGLAAVMARVLLGVLQASREPEPEAAAVCADRLRLLLLLDNTPLYVHHGKSASSLNFVRFQAIENSVRP